MTSSAFRGSSVLANELDEHCARLAACRRCVLGPGILPIVSTTREPRAILVGQAPGKVERHGGRPFARRAGRTLFQWLERAGLDEATARRTLYIAAITRCYPGPHPSGRGDRVPSPLERSNCGDWLSAELSIIRPSLIIPVGRLAIDRFFGPVPLSSVVGRVHNVTHSGGCSVAIPLPHPSGASSWANLAANRTLLHRSLDLLRERLAHMEDSSRSVA